MRFEVVLISVNIALAAAQIGWFRSESGPQHGKAVVCSTFSAKSASADSNLDLNLCSHLIFVDNSFYSNKEPWDPANDITEYIQFAAVRSNYPHLKISVGILRDVNDYFEIAFDADKRREFVESAVEFVLTHGLDGLDLFWSYRDLDKTSAAKESFLLLVTELANSLKPHNLALSSAFDTESKFGEIYDYPAMAEYLSHLLILDASIVDHLVDKFGINSSQIIMGTRFNGFEVAPQLRSPDQGSSVLKYDQVCDLLENNNILKKEYDESTGMMMASFTDAQGAARFIRFENTRTIANKTRAAMRRNLGGIFVFTVDADDVYGECPVEEDTFDDFLTLNIPKRSDADAYPLLNVVNDAIVASLDEIKEEEEQKEEQVENTTPNNVSPSASGGFGFNLISNLISNVQGWLANSNGMLSNVASTVWSNFGNLTSTNQTSNEQA